MGENIVLLVFMILAIPITGFVTIITVGLTGNTEIVSYFIGAVILEFGVALISGFNCACGNI